MQWCGKIESQVVFKKRFITVIKSQDNESDVTMVAM